MSDSSAAVSAAASHAAEEALAVLSPERSGRLTVLMVPVGVRSRVSMVGSDERRGQIALWIGTGCEGEEDG